MHAAIKHGIFPIMITRLLHITERLGYLAVGLSLWSGARLATWYNGSVTWFASQIRVDRLDTASARREDQVRSLSGAVVILLVLTLGLALWASQVQGIPTIIQGVFQGSSLSVAEGQSLDGLPAADRPFLDSGGTILFSMYVGGQQDIFALAAGQAQPIRLTDHAADDRDAVWSPDGQKIAFASRREGNWDLYVLDIQSGEIARLTYDLAFEAGPTWSPDSLWVAYEAYYENNLDIHIIRADGSEGPYAVTRHPAPDFSPSWRSSSEGRELAYTSLREGNKEIYLISLDNPDEINARNLTNTPNLNEDEPAWAPGGGLLAYTANDTGIPLVYVMDINNSQTGPSIVGQGGSPAWAPDGANLVFLAERGNQTLVLAGEYGAWNSSVQSFVLPGISEDLDWSYAAVPVSPRGSLAFAYSAPITPPYEETIVENTVPYRLRNLPGVINEKPWLSDRVDDSFVALKDAANRRAGWDFLSRLDHVFWALDRPTEPGQAVDNWHKTGRAFSIAQSYNSGSPAQVEIVPEQAGPEQFWRLYVRCAIQDGTLGEPLREIPWDFQARTQDIDAYNTGGQLRRDIPPGYYIDFSRLAQVYSWARTPSDPSWRSNWPGVLYWQYEKRDNLSWDLAMLEIYTANDLQGLPGAPGVLDAPLPAPTPADNADSEQSP